MDKDDQTNLSFQKQLNINPEQATEFKVCEAVANVHNDESVALINVKKDSSTESFGCILLPDGKYNSDEFINCIKLNQKKKNAENVVSYMQNNFTKEDKPFFVMDAFMTCPDTPSKFIGTVFRSGILFQILDIVDIISGFQKTPFSCRELFVIDIFACLIYDGLLPLIDLACLYEKRIGTDEKARHLVILLMKATKISSVSCLSFIPSVSVYKRV